ncbi:MAG: polyprenyl synthetase family protein [Candidatus Omnitrophica bacterium]|nr:polyprenyl synthetase family protein [Candidatus Omnitrophota bacterium]
MPLKKIYRPIRNELKRVEKLLERVLQGTSNKTILRTNRYLLGSPGKRLRPALVILSAKAARRGALKADQLINIAAAMELIHMASLMHDDVVDHCDIRHHKPTVNYKWNQDLSIVLGDYLYSLAFKLISTCDNMDILNCISSATEQLCEGELIQVAERDNLSLSKRRYILIVKKKTASLFAAACRVGAMVSSSPQPVREGLTKYGLNFGIAFQIIDDYLDIVSTQEEMGKPAGLDIKAGELTLPLLYLAGSDQDYFRGLFSGAQSNKDDLERLKELLVNSKAVKKTKKEIFDYAARAKHSLGVCRNSEFKQTLIMLVDFIQQKVQ